MQLTRHRTDQGTRWAKDGFFLPPELTLSTLLENQREAMAQQLTDLPCNEPANGELLAPVDPLHEVWAAGVTYLRSLDARRIESQVANVYDRVYEAERPQLFSRRRGGALSAPAHRSESGPTAGGTYRSRSWSS